MRKKVDESVVFVAETFALPATFIFSNAETVQNAVINADCAVSLLLPKRTFNKLNKLTYFKSLIARKTRNFYYIFHGAKDLNYF